MSKSAHSNPATYGDVKLPTAGLAGNFINGEWRKPLGGKTLAVINPCRLDTVANVGAADAREVDAAVAAAKAAFPKWRRRAARERGAMLIEFGNRITANAEEIAKLLAAETGNATAYPEPA